MAEKIIIAEGAMVKKSNILARASWSPGSIWESRIVAIVAAQVRRDDEDFYDYRIPVQELLKAAGRANSGNSYEEIRRMVRQAMSRIVGLKQGRHWRYYTLFSKCAYEEGDSDPIVQFHPDLKSHYLDLKKNFTTYSLSEYLSLPSIYSQRLYEILCSWDDCVTTGVGLAELHKMLDTPPSFRRNFKDFRRRVLDLAHQDITTRTQMRYEWEAVTVSGKPLKRGEKVGKIRFLLGKKTMAEVSAKKKKAASSKQSGRNNRLFVEAVRCNEDHRTGCGALRATKACCEICMKAI